MGSGPTYYSGWITAFCFWDTDGKVKSRIDEDCLVLDGDRYHRIDSNDVPPGYSSVPVLINDNKEIMPAMMIAGSVGIGYSSSRQQCVERAIGLDTVQPVVGWWMLEKKGQNVLYHEQELERQKGQGWKGALQKMRNQVGSQARWALCQCPVQVSDVRHVGIPHRLPPPFCFLRHGRSEMSGLGEENRMSIEPRVSKPGYELPYSMLTALHEIKY